MSNQVMPMRPTAHTRRHAVDTGIPQHYTTMSDAELDARITSARAILGERVVILGHHYQRDEIIKFADARGDSYKLSKLAASRPEAEYIIFCGVHFMAESADILSGPHQKVILPNLAAGCSMADMANIAEVEECWGYLEEICGAGTIPITYMNSAANLKAFCGEHGGLVCTSSNAEQILTWALQQGKRVLFFPDQHLGRNTGVKLGIPQEKMVIWNHRNVDETLENEAALRTSTLILWNGYCSVHGRFTVDQITKARQDYPGVQVVVHPECRMPIVQAADYNGSTDYIIKLISAAPAGTIWAIGTEINLVRRLANEHPDQTIFCLDPVICPCSTMYRIHPAYLAWVLEELVAGRIINQISVDPAIAANARLALDRMLALGG